MRRRPRLLVFIAAAVAVFLIVSFVLARWLTVENGERDALTRVLQAQARGDVTGMLEELDGCAQRPECVATVRANAGRLRSQGRVEIVRLDSGTSYTLSSKTAPTRVVWKTPSRLTVVQCVQVRRKGNVLTGLTASLLAISPPISRTAACD